MVAADRDVFLHPGHAQFCGLAGVAAVHLDAGQVDEHLLEGALELRGRQQFLPRLEGAAREEPFAGGAVIGDGRRSGRGLEYRGGAGPEQKSAEVDDGGHRDGRATKAGKCADGESDCRGRDQPLGRPLISFANGRIFSLSPSSDRLRSMLRVN